MCVFARFVVVVLFSVCVCVACCVCMYFGMFKCAVLGFRVVCVSGRLFVSVVCVLSDASWFVVTFVVCVCVLYVCSIVCVRVCDLVSVRVVIVVM